MPRLDRPCQANQSDLPWGDMALGQILRRVRDRLDADRGDKAAAIAG
jgi:hypothetical protein